MEIGKWIQYFTEESGQSRGTPYYYNKETGKTQWEKPVEFQYSKYCKKRGKLHVSVDDS